VIVLFNKPYGVLCQFSGGGGRPTLAAHVPIPGIYPAGRLDLDSEGLLVLTDDGGLVHRLADPRQRKWKTYLVQVEGEADGAALARLRSGLVLRDGPTLPARARHLPGAPEWLWPRDPPVRYRARIPTSWLEIGLQEGRNRQVRRMTAAVGLPTLRLVRTRIGPFALDGLMPGEYRVIDSQPRQRAPVAARRSRPAAGRAWPERRRG